MKPATILYLHSAGGVIYKKADDSFYVALIAVKNKTIWTLPKGLVDKEEKAEETAIREVKEETGLLGEIVASLGEKSYWFYIKDKNAKCKKKVTYFLMRYIEGNIEDFCWEVDEAKWFGIDQAIKKVTYKRDREILQKAKEILERDF